MTAREIVAALGGRWHGVYGLAPCPAHDDGREPALKVVDDHRKNDGIDLHCFAGCDWRDVKAALRRHRLLVDHDGGRDRDRDRDRGRGHHHGGVHRQRAVQHQLDEEDRRRIGWAQKTWASAKPAAGSLVEVYLRARGITLPIPPTIRYAPTLRHGPTGLDLPCMIAGVQAPDRHITGIHRTFLTMDGTRKAQVSSPKMMLGCCAAGAVRLGPAGPKIAIAEGIETALSVMQATDLVTWAALSTSGIRALVLPTQVREVVLCPDGDEPGEQAAQVAAKRFVTEGRKVRIARPPAGLDFNDVLIRPENVVSFPSRAEAAHG